MLEGVVERGTAVALKTDRYDFAGKTGTTKVGYDKDEIKYNASFCGYWPAKNPKYSMIVVVYGLKGAKYYGTVVAGPIFKRIMDWSYALQDGSVAMHEASQTSGTNGVAGFDGEVYGYGEDYKEIFSDVKVEYLDAGRWIKGGNDDRGKVLTGKAKISTDRVPEMEGMGVRDAVYVLENLGLRVRLEGTGHVVKQSLKSGTLIDNQEITLYLN
jgi:cell division protein FtsI (penicillin-binding protein 3)